MKTKRSYIHTQIFPTFTITDIRAFKHTL